MRIEATVYKRSIGFSKVYDFPLDEDELMEDVENQNEEFSVDYEAFGRDVRLEGSAIDCDGKYLMGG